LIVRLKRVRESKCKKPILIFRQTLFYVMESDHETAHYGIAKEKYGYIKCYRFSMKVLDKFSPEFGILIWKEEHTKKLNKKIAILVVKYTSNINIIAFRKLLRKMRIRREQA